MENIAQVKPSRNAGGITRVFAVVGFIALLAIGMWGSVQIASAVPGALSNLASAIASLTSIFVPADETVTVTIPSSEALSGEAFILSWTHDKKSTEGSYTFRYDCKDGVYFTHAGETVFCNVPFNFLNNGNTLSLVAMSENNRFIDATVYIDFTPNGANTPTVTGLKTFTITNTNIGSSPVVGGNPSTTPTTPTTPPVTTPRPPVNPGPTTTTTYPVATTTRPVTSDPNGYVDLVPRIIEIGVVDKVTGAFTASSTPSRSQRIAVRFAVENLGTKTSKQFNFNAVLPTLPYHIFSSPGQQELRPGDRIEFTLGFDSYDPNGNGEFTVNVDPGNRENEKNEVNNIVKYIVTVAP